MSWEGWPNYLMQQLEALRPAADAADPGWQVYGYVTYVDPAGQLRVAAAVLGSQGRDDDASYASAAEELPGVAGDWRSRPAEDPDGRMWVLMVGAADDAGIPVAEGWLGRPVVATSLPALGRTRKPKPWRADECVSFGLQANAIHLR